MVWTMQKQAEQKPMQKQKLPFVLHINLWTPEKLYIAFFNVIHAVQIESWHPSNLAEQSLKTLNISRNRVDHSGNFDQITKEREEIRRESEDMHNRLEESKKGDEELDEDGKRIPWDSDLLCDMLLLDELIPP
ncbi:hypothetical protein Nepgr_007443 [Nepenthes gracilis]|uniref:Uncharacterized protein n=1 Tax=Nepenthes gracilis TaxID=150966 RepID=A0AAD3S6Z9_NEPGR|nr:hypothetical protein Nepgr_007443 [Nepenthes gracilis]